MCKEIIEDLKITVRLPKKVLDNLNKAGYLNDYTSYSTGLTIRSYGSRETLNKTIADMITASWGYDNQIIDADQSQRDQLNARLREG